MIKNIDISIWGRAFTLSIEYDCYKGESVTDAQLDAISWFLENKELIDKGKGVVENYCKEQLAADTDNQKKDNIFSYIMPECLFVKREEMPRVAILCKYRYDLEHGLAVVFSLDGKIIVGAQDIIL